MHKLITYVRLLLKRGNKKKLRLHPSVKKNKVSFIGEINVGSGTSLNTCKLTGKINIGSAVTITKADIAGSIQIGDHSKIVDGVELHGTIDIGKYTSINGPNTDLRSRLNPIKIGNFCSIARNVTFQEFNHDFTRLTSYFVNHNMLGKSAKEDIVSKGTIHVGHDVWIGTHCVILSGVTIGTGAVIAANTVVSKDVPPYAIVGGNPATIIKYRFSENTISRLLASEWWTKTDDEIISYYNDFNNNLKN